jgi:hypothetical protein
MNLMAYLTIFAVLLFLVPIGVWVYWDDIKYFFEKRKIPEEQKIGEDSKVFIEELMRK